MVYGLWQSAAGLQVQEYRQAIIANNLANADTPGFKADRIAFQERLNAATAHGDMRARNPVLDAMTGGLFETPIYTDFAQGNIIPSNNPLDLAVEGDGFLTVQTKDGARYTRDGRLLMNADGELVHAASGGAVLGNDSQPIVLDPVAREAVKIDESGQVSQGERIAGRLALVDFGDRQQLGKVGENLYSANGLKGTEAHGSIRQSAYEASTVEPANVLVDLISASRAYEANARLIALQDDSLGRVVNELGRVG
ncbi:MAG TPA: flagellar hook-basal body protein [Phycisphaerae bacterium]|nr:flagellar hook-basal body protein [Phycisphaerae bacterium]